MKRFSFTLAVAATLLFAAGISQVYAQNGAVMLRAVTAWDKSQPFADMYMEWIKRVNVKGAGKVRIDYTGGPEVFPAFEQLEPLKRGIVSTLVTSTGYVGALPELNVTWLGFGATPAELRASGLVAALDKVVREKAGVTLLGLPLQQHFNVYLKRSVPNVDLTQIKMRSLPVFDPVLRGLGAVTVTVPYPELLTALETGVVDGFAFPAVAVVAPGFTRTIKYKFAPPWWVGTDVALMNAAAYDKLSPDLKKLLIDTMIEIEKEVPAYYGGKEKSENAALAKLGVQDLQTSEADLLKIRKLQWEGGVQTFLLKPSPKYGPQLVEIMKRFAPK